MHYPLGGERVELVNLTPEGRTNPAPEPERPFDSSTRIRPEADEVSTRSCSSPTGSGSCSRRAYPAAAANLHEIRLVVAGRMPGEWYADRDWSGGRRGKPRFKSLADFRPGTGPG